MLEIHLGPPKVREELLTGHKGKPPADTTQSFGLYNWTAGGSALLEPHKSATLPVDVQPPGTIHGVAAAITPAIFRNDGLRLEAEMMGKNNPAKVTFTGMQLPRPPSRSNTLNSSPMRSPATPDTLPETSRQHLGWNIVALRHDTQTAFRLGCYRTGVGWCRPAWYSSKRARRALMD